MPWTAKNRSNGFTFLTAEQRCEELPDDGKETVCSFLVAIWHGASQVAAH